MRNNEVFEFYSLADKKPSPGESPQGILRVMPRFGKGCLLRAVPLSSGFCIYVQDFTLYGSGAVTLEGNSPFESSWIFFYTTLSGINRISENWPGSTFLSRLSGVELKEYSTMSFDATLGQPVRSFSIGVAPGTLADICGLERNDVLEMLYKVNAFLKRKSTTFPLLSLDMELNVVALQAQRALDSCPGDLLYLKAKALEFLALHVRQLGAISGTKFGEEVGRNIRDKVDAACDILRMEMAHPPGARELASRVGMNHSQLVAAFRDKLGLTPFSFLRDIRLKCARDLLAAGRCNVTEAAFLVGYGSLSHFSKSFTDQFGMTPKSWAKSRAAERREGSGETL